MIKSKEDLHHTFIDGYCEELKNKLLEKAKEFGLEVNPSAHKNLAIGINLAQVGKPSYFQVDHNGTHLEYYRDLLKYRELTLEDFEEENKQENNMIDRQKLLNGYIKNDIKTGGELFKKWKEACLYYEFSYEWMTSGNIETNLGYTEGCYIDRFEDFNGCGEIEAFLAVNPDYEELTLEDFEEGSKEESSSENTKCRYEKVDISPAEIYSAMLNGETFYVNEKEMYWNGNAFWCDCERVRFIEDTHEVCRKVEVTWQDEVLAYLNKPSEEGFEEELPSKFRVDYMDDSFHLVDSEFLAMCRVALRATGELK